MELIWGANFLGLLDWIILKLWPNWNRV